MSFETSFDSKQPKLEPKLVSALSETKTFVSVVSLLYQNREFRLNQNKQKTNLNSLIGSIFCYFLQKIKGFPGFFHFFPFFSVCFEIVCFGCFASMYTETVSFDVSFEPKQTEDPPKQFKREYTV